MTFSMSLILFSLILGLRFIIITTLLLDEELCPVDFDTAAFTGRVLAAVVEFDTTLSRLFDTD
jgi:hypothetical protein